METNGFGKPTNKPINGDDVVITVTTATTMIMMVMTGRTQKMMTMTSVDDDGEHYGNADDSADNNADDSE